MLLDRVSHDDNTTFELTGTRTCAPNLSYSYLGFARVHGGCMDAIEEGIKRYGLTVCGLCLEGGNLDPHQQYEALLAMFLGQEDALIIKPTQSYSCL